VDGSYTSLYRCASTWALRIASAAFAPREDADATSLASPRNRSLFHRRIFRCDGPCFPDLPFVAVEVCPLSGICQKNSKQMQKCFSESNTCSCHEPGVPGYPSYRHLPGSIPWFQLQIRP
jgi:hypothetical protein